MARTTAAQPGERVREMILVTTLRDAARYPAIALAATFRRRWQIERKPISNRVCRLSGGCTRLAA